MDRTNRWVAVLLVPVALLTACVDQENGADIGAPRTTSAPTPLVNVPATVPATTPAVACNGQWRGAFPAAALEGPVLDHDALLERPEGQAIETFFNRYNDDFLYDRADGFVVLRENALVGALHNGRVDSSFSMEKEGETLTMKGFGSCVLRRVDGDTRPRTSRWRNARRRARSQRVRRSLRRWRE